MKPCEYYIELLSAGLDGMLSDEQEQELAEHLAACPACRELGPQLVAAHAAFPQMEELQAPEGFAEGVMARVRAEEKAKPKVVPFFRRPAVKSLSALAACAAGAKSKNHAQSQDQSEYFFHNGYLPEEFNFIFCKRNITILFG